MRNSECGIIYNKSFNTAVFVYGELKLFCVINVLVIASDVAVFRSSCHCGAAAYCTPHDAHSN